MDVQPYPVETRCERGGLISKPEPYSGSTKEDGSRPDVRQALLGKQGQAGGDR